MAQALIGKIVINGDKEKAKNYFNAVKIESALNEYYKKRK